MPYAITKSAWKLPHIKGSIAEIEGKFRTTVGTYPGHDQGMDMSADFMCDRVNGDKIAAYAQANARRLGIQYIIWRQRIWSVQRSGEGWRGMADRGSISANHYDHVHITWNKAPGTGGSVVDSSPGNDNGRVDVGDIPGVEQAQQIGEIYGIIKSGVNWATNKQNWINLLLILVGAWLILIALWRIAGTEVIRTVKVVAS